VFTATEFERCYASNGPTEGELKDRDGAVPSSAGIVVHALEHGPWSPVNTMYAMKFLHYLKEKLPRIDPVILLNDSYSPDPLQDGYHHRWDSLGCRIVRYKEDLSVKNRDGTLEISCSKGSDENRFSFDLLLLGTPMAPSPGTLKMMETLGIDGDDEGFAAPSNPLLSAVVTKVPGVFSAGCAAGPAAIADAVIQAAAAAGRVLSGGES